jgi:hypothetical protein
VGLELGILVWHTHQHSYTPALNADHRFNDSIQEKNFIEKIQEKEKIDVLRIHTS